MCTFGTEVLRPFRAMSSGDTGMPVSSEYLMRRADTGCSRWLVACRTIASPAAKELSKTSLARPTVDRSSRAAQTGRCGSTTSGNRRGVGAPLRFPERTIRAMHVFETLDRETADRADAH